MRIVCPHCHTSARIRSSKPVSDISREMKLQCQNVDCAHTWVAVVEAVRTIAPSMTPNPKVYIPLSPRSPAYTSPDSRQLGLALDCPPPR